MIGLEKTRTVALNVLSRYLPYDLANELAGDVVIHLLEKADSEDELIDESLAFSYSQIKYAALRILERGKQIKEHNLICTDSIELEDENEDESTIKIDNAVNAEFIKKYRNSDDAMIECIELLDQYKREIDGEEPVEVKVDIIQILCYVFGDKYKRLIQHYFEYLGDKEFIYSDFGKTLGVSKQYISKRLQDIKCLSQEEIREIIKSAEIIG